MDQAGDNSPVRVGDSPIHGKGLFASRLIRAGELIGHYEGKQVSEDGMHVLWVEEEDNHWVGYEGSNDMRFMNHDDHPNAELDGRDCYALEDIPPGREITIDYGWNET